MNMNKEQAELRLRELTSTPGILFRLSTCVGNKCACTDRFVLTCYYDSSRIGENCKPQNFLL